MLTKLLAQQKSITSRILVATFYRNQQTTIICCYSPYNEAETETFYDKLSSITRQSPKRNVLVIGGDFNAYLGQDTGHKFAYHY